MTPETLRLTGVERELIGGLVDGIRWWAAQEDGIPQEVCKAFNDAMGYLGWEYSTQVDTDALANQPAPDSPVDVGEVAEAIAWLRRAPSFASPPTDEAIADLIESLAKQVEGHEDAELGRLRNEKSQAIRAIELAVKDTTWYAERNAKKPIGPGGLALRVANYFVEAALDKLEEAQEKEV